MTLLGRQHGLSHAHRPGRHLHQFVFADEADGLLQNCRSDRREDDAVVFSGCPHVGQFFGLARVQIFNLILCLSIFLVFSVLGYKKAKQMGLNPVLWALICFIFNFWGYIYLLYFKKPNRTTST